MNDLLSGLAPPSLFSKIPFGTNCGALGPPQTLQFVLQTASLERPYITDLGGGTPALSTPPSFQTSGCHKETFPTKSGKAETA